MSSAGFASCATPDPNRLPTNAPQAIFDCAVVGKLLAGVESPSPSMLAQRAGDASSKHMAEVVPPENSPPDLRDIQSRRTGSEQLHSSAAPGESTGITSLFARVSGAGNIQSTYLLLILEELPLWFPKPWC